MAAMNDSLLRQRRVECGLTQTELAARAGVSRQLVAAVEAGHNTPAVDAALGLARALATSVEELFVDAPSEAVAALGGRLRAGVPLRVGRVAGQLVATELPDHGTAGASWGKPDGVFESGRLRLFPGATPAGLVLAGCDPALGVAEAMLQGLGSSSLLAISAPTGTALRALRRGGVHAAVVHGLPGELPEPPVPVVRLHLARWQVGLAIAPRLHGHSLEAVLRSDVRVAQRDPAAASQQAFERAAATAGIPSPRSGPQATGHIDAARMQRHKLSILVSSHWKTTRSRSGSPNGGWITRASTRSEISLTRAHLRSASPCSVATTSRVAATASNSPRSGLDRWTRGMARR
jgi:DNA-binding XRE family transcriptional regulator